MCNSNKKLNRAETQYLHTHTHTHTHLSHSKIKIVTRSFRAFSLAEMMIVMLIVTLVLAATTPLITKRHKSNNLESSTLTKIKNDVATLQQEVDDLKNNTNNGDCGTDMIKIVDLCVAKTDSSPASWDNARVECWNQGLRLPTIEELDTLYYYQSSSGMTVANYWSATVESDYQMGGNSLGTNAWFQSFSTGGQHNSYKNGAINVRCVRSAY